MTGWVNNQVSKIKSIVSSRPSSIGAQNYMALARMIDNIDVPEPSIDVDVGESRHTSVPHSEIA